MLVVLFLSYYVSSTMFYHTHHFFWGTVTHSHPYFPANKDADNHSHTPAQCQTISLLTNLLLIAIVAAVFFCATTIVQRIYFRVHTFKSLFRPVFSPLRAPPVFHLL
jgi:hypothetical protein